MNQQYYRSEILTYYGAAAAEVEELLAYNRNVFDVPKLESLPQFPLHDEPHLAVWRKYQENGSLDSLKRALVQLQFPIQTGIAVKEFYRAATLRGKPTYDMSQATGLQLQQPEKLQITIHSSLAGAIPVLFTENRDDFVALVRALARRNEPELISDSMGACMVANYNNWGRINDYRQKWSSKHEHQPSELDWQKEFRRLISQKHLYQDRFIILSDSFYSNVEPRTLNLSELAWRQISRTIRLKHECTHYFTRRVLGSMQNNLLDEIIADYQGIVGAIGCYRADWFLHFMGLESFPNYRSGGRFENYFETAKFSAKAVKILQHLVKAAAENLEKFDRNYGKNYRTIRGRVLILLTLCSFTLEELAAKKASEKIWQRLQHIDVQSYVRTDLSCLRVSSK